MLKLKKKSDLTPKQLLFIKGVTAYCLLIILGLSKYISNQLFEISGLPEIPTEADNLTSNQIILGYFISLTKVVISVLDIILPLIVWPYIIYLIYKFIKLKK